MVTVQIPSVLQTRCDVRKEIQVRAKTLRSLLRELESDHPQLYHSVCEETGRKRRHVNLFINETLVREETQYEATLSDGDVVHILQAVSGG